VNVASLRAVVRVDIKRQMDEHDVAAIQALIDEATEADGHRPVDEHRWLDLVQGGREGYAGLIAYHEGHDHPVGYGQLSRGPTSWALEFVVDPHHRTPGNTIGIDLVTAAVDLVGAEGGGHLHLWVSKPRPEHDRIAAATGLKPGRALYQMRRPLPVGEAYTLETRPFRPGLDEHAWLEVNNRAFDWHPEQGGWDEATLKAREAEPWFDPRGFLLHEEGARLAGFCWTKIHADERPVLGEIYVIAVDPDFQGRGLGRRLVLAGLDYLSGKGVTIGMLYVDAENRSAVKLYVDMGFDVDHIDRAYVGDIPAGPPR
jgi:mycothiol synthase